MKRIKGLCLVSLGLVSVFALGVTGSASAKVLLFKSPESFPIHFAGTGGASTLETLSGKAITSTQTDLLAVVLNSTLFDLHINFLHSTAENGLAECSNTSNPTTILVNLLGHLGLADPGDKPAVLLLVPSGFEFVCSALGGIVKETVKVKGSVIGEITKPTILTAGATELTTKFEAAGRGVQKFTEFLLNNTLTTNLMQESSIGGGAFELSAQAGEGTLKILKGTFEIVDE